MERNSAAELARKALQLDPNLAEAHAVLADLAMEYDWDWSRAERELRLAVAGPPSAKAELSYAFFLIFHGRFAEADPHLRRAQELEPFDTATMLSLSQAWYLEGRFAQVREISQRVLAMHPNAAETRKQQLATSHIWDGQARTRVGCSGTNQETVPSRFLSLRQWRERAPASAKRRCG